MKKIFTILSFVFCFAVTAQKKVTIGTVSTDTTALLEVNANNKGLLIPRLTNAQMIAIVNPGNGLLVYNTDSAAFAYRTATAWVFLKGNATASNDWSTKGNAGTDTSKNFIGTTDDVDVIFKRDNLRAGLLSLTNTSWGRQALNFVSTGTSNTAVGYQSLRLIGSGSNNTATGTLSLPFNTDGSNNTAIGYLAGYRNTGSSNVYLGFAAGFNETGSNKLYITNSETSAANSLIYGEFDNKILSVDGKLGIGTTTPQAKLEVVGKIKVTTAAGSTGLDLATADSYAELRQIRNTTNTIDHNLYFGFSGDAASSINFYNGGTVPSVTMVSNKLGVGTTSPANKLSVIGNADFSGKVGIGNTTPHGDLQFANTLTNRKIVLLEGADNDHQYNGFGINTSIVRYQAAAISNSHVFYAGTSPTTSNELIRIEGNGNVGIGNSSPTAPLQFAQNFNQNRKIVLYQDADNDHQFNGFGVNPFILRYQVPTTSGNHTFYAGTSATTSNELMRITGNGEVGIGKIPLTGNNDSRLQIKQKGTQNGIGVHAANSTNHWDFYVTSDAESNFYLWYNGAYKGSFSNVNGAYISASDRRMKKDITQLQPALNSVMQLQAYQYHYLDNKTTDRFTNGFMAQDVQKLFPDAVVENLMKDGETRLGINYQYFTVLAIKSLQEQQQQIQLQEERITKLETLVKALAEKNNK